VITVDDDDDDDRSTTTDWTVYYRKKKNRYAWQKHQTAYLINIAIPNHHNQFSIITSKL